MRIRVLLLAAALSIAAVPLAAQKSVRPSSAESFIVSGLPKTPTTDLEHQIFTLLRVHRKGDLQDATRIHMMLADYYRQRGDTALAADCIRLAGEAWTASQKRPAVVRSANADGTPPFEPAGGFARLFTHVDDVDVQHTWRFYEDGTYEHALAPRYRADDAGPVERGWYRLEEKVLRLWVSGWKAERRVTFELVGADGAVMDGVKLQGKK